MPVGPPYARRLLDVIAAAEPLLASIPDDAAAQSPAPGKWSPKEIIGHLVDSASNNHQRFVRAAWQDDLVFPTYAQEEWVELQAYRDADWRDLLTLWASFNRHIAHVMMSIPADARARRHTRHNLDRVAWRAVSATQPVTLDYFMEDYVGHLEHHLRQVLGATWTDRGPLEARAGAEPAGAQRGGA